MGNFKLILNVAIVVVVCMFVVITSYTLGGCGEKKECRFTPFPVDSQSECDEKAEEMSILENECVGFFTEGDLSGLCEIRCFGEICDDDDDLGCEFDTVRIVDFDDVDACTELEEELECLDSFLVDDRCFLCDCILEFPEESPSPSPSPPPTATPPACVPEPEICNNFIDDDCDRFIDCHDPDCKRDPACAPPPPSSPSPSPSPSPCTG